MKALLPIKTNYSLSALNTFAIPAKAKYYLPIHSIDQLQAVYSDSALKALPRLVLGGGSNVLFTGDFPGLVMHMCLAGKKVSGEDEHFIYLTGAAGENWHEFVLWTLQNGCGGLENLSLIPGTLGAAPVQNIGAYGSELQDYFYSLKLFDFETGKLDVFSRQDCQFSYRDSIFKQEKSGRYVIVEVTFALPKKWEANLAYSEVENAIKKRGAVPITPELISREIIAIRKGKLPDPAVLGNAGSFFKNPTVSSSEYKKLIDAHPEMPAYILPDGNYRIAAGWLIDRCGWKGKRQGNAGVYQTQALVLINYGGASGEEIVRLANLIQQDVKKQFDLWLEPEPFFVR